MAVDGDGDGGECLNDLFGDPVCLVGEDAAVRVAQAQAVRAGVEGAFERIHRIRLVRFEAVKEVFGVEDDLFALLREKADAAADHFEVLLGGDFQHVGGVADMALPEDGDVFRPRGEQGFKVAVLCGVCALAAGGAEGDDVRVFQLHAADALKKLHLRGVGKGVARLDEVDAEIVEGTDDLYFVLHGEGDVCSLRSVAQGGIEYL